jgi:cytochrome P450
LERIVPEGGLQIGEHYIPKDTVIGISPWVVHYDKDVFGDDVDTFRPERWEDDNAEGTKQRLKDMERAFFAVSKYASSEIRSMSR